MITKEPDTALDMELGPILRGEKVPEEWAQALEWFSGSTTKLKDAYLSLKAQVRKLNLELGETNRRLKENLEEKERLRSYLSHILEGLSIGVMVSDLGGALTLSNHAARFLLGTKGDPVGSSLERELLAALPKEDVRAVISPRGERAERTSEHRVKDRLGETRNLIFKSNRLRDSLGVELGTLVTVEDLTELRTMQDEVARSQRLAAMGEMAVCIAHEVRNPLGSIHLFSGLMAQESSCDARNTLADKIHLAIGAVDNILTNLLTFARPMRPRLAPLDPGPILKECLDFVGPLAGQQGTAIDLVNTERVPKIYGDRGLLKQALLNLLLNALQAMPGGGRLRAWARETSEDSGLWRGPGPGERGEWVEIGIEDTGEGIPEETLARIFDPFFTTRPEGTGLGLSIVHNIVRAHRGRVRIRSHAGEGTCVRIQVPLIQPTHSEEA